MPQTVHVNGTPLRELLRYQLQLKRAYNDLLDALLIAQPNPRDYPGREVEYGVDRARALAEIERITTRRDQAYADALSLMEQSGPESWRSVG
jgi:hypothetical protein